MDLEHNDQFSSLSKLATIASTPWPVLLATLGIILSGEIA